MPQWMQRKSAGIYASTDGGERWRAGRIRTLVSGAAAAISEIRVSRLTRTHFVANTASYKSTDGGRTF